jgi:hypothetical protein
MFYPISRSCCHATRISNQFNSTNTKFFVARLELTLPEMPSGDLKNEIFLENPLSTENENSEINLAVTTTLSSTDPIIRMRTVFNSIFGTAKSSTFLTTWLILEISSNHLCHFSGSNYKVVTCKVQQNFLWRLSHFHELIKL